MLSATDAALVARDPALPGLPVLLDDELLRGLAGAPVSRRYLRYKPGTSCVLGAVVDLPTGPAEAFVTAYTADGAAKADKTLQAGTRGSVLFADSQRGLLAALAPADRDLPFVPALADERRLRSVLRRVLPGSGGWHGSRCMTLSYKPQRRWVGLVTSDRGRRVVLRAYRPPDAAAAGRALRALGGRAPRTPRLLGMDAELGLLVLEYVEGRTLDGLPAAAGAAALPEAGAALARLHSHPRCGLPLRGPQDDAQALIAAAEQVAVLLPTLGRDALLLAEELSRRLCGMSAQRAVLHGDFSADQVVVAGDGQVALLDLDRCTEGDPAYDLASFAASLTTQQVLGAAPCGADVLAQVLTGYRAVRPLPREEAVTAHTAALLLRRAGEPFRLCLPDWPERVRALLGEATAAARLDDPLAQAPDDLVEPVLGGPLSWQVLKDKPGRRRTSRATGPGGTGIVKVYASGRAPVVAARVDALRAGPPEPAVPVVLRCEASRHVVVLSEVPGRPFREFLLAGDDRAAARVGRALAGWHVSFRGRLPGALRPHTWARELEVLQERCGSAPPELAEAVRRAAAPLRGTWPTDTVVHRDLYEDQIMLDRAVGLVDLDDAACGPAELDLGNLLAHLSLLSRRSGRDLDAAVAAMLHAYREVAPLQNGLLGTCRTLSLLRLACVHRDPELVRLAAGAEAAVPSSP